jgi:hypothetical protein
MLRRIVRAGSHSQVVGDGIEAVNDGLWKTQNDGAHRSPVGVSAIADAVDGDAVLGFVEEDAVIADAEAEQAFKLAAEGFDLTFACFCVAVESGQNLHSRGLVDGADLRGHVGLEANFLHLDS